MWVLRWRASIGDRVEFAPLEEAVSSPHISLSRKQLLEALTLIEPDGTTHRGAGAVFHTLSHAPATRFAGAAYDRLPGFAAASELAYRVVANHRQLASRATRILVGPDLLPEHFAVTRRIFLVLLGIVYFAAFASLGVQVEGLIGSAGILPADELLQAADRQLGAAKYWRVPTLLWLGGGDDVLRGICIAGALLSLLPIAGLAPRAALLALWALYLSLASVGGIFLNYQWDALLLECGLLALFFAPGGLHPRRARVEPVSKLGLWLLRWLLFRLILLSGLVKIIGEHPTWRDGTALAFHYFTQPIPSWTSYYAHHLPAAIHSFSTTATIWVEVGGALLILGTRRMRMLAFVLLAGLQLLIAASGNYGFFNLLTLALCATLLGDRSWLHLVPVWLRDWQSRRARDSAASPSAAPVWAWLGAFRSGHRLRRWSAGLAATVLIGLGAFAALDRVGMRVPRPDWVRGLERLAAPARSINSYGLFATMTRSRPEIVLEGSLDGYEWRPYEFEWKPGTLGRRPSFAGLHMPRLDWQLWFAAWRGCERARWFHRFMLRLLVGTPEVVALLAFDPFPGDPPRYLRSRLFKYEFEARSSSHWWRRSLTGPYCATVTLRGGELRRAKLPERQPQ